MGVENLRFNVVDMFEAPSQEMLTQGVDFINENVKDGKVVYVHCKAGRSRSATLVGCYLMKVYTFSKPTFFTASLCDALLCLVQKHNWTPEDAIRHLRSVRSHVVFTQGKLDALKTFYQNQVYQSVS